MQHELLVFPILQRPISQSVCFVLSQDATEVTETEPSLTQRFEKFQHDFQEFVDRVEVKAKEVFHDAHYSELSNQTR